MLSVSITWCHINYNSPTLIIGSCYIHQKLRWKFHSQSIHLTKFRHNSKVRDSVKFFMPLDFSLTIYSFFNHLSFLEEIYYTRCRKLSFMRVLGEVMVGNLTLNLLKRLISEFELSKKKNLLQTEKSICNLSMFLYMIILSCLNLNVKIPLVLS